MSATQKKQKMIRAIEERGCLLVYPIKNKKEPRSLWSELYPRSEMRWEWDADADNRIGELWILREELSRSGKVIYSKWYQGRATFFSKEVFVHLLAYLGSCHKKESLPRSSQEALESFLMDSPQSTKIIKENLGWQGKMMESHFNRAMKPLWNFLLLVGYGEVEDSSFPSLNMAATQTLFEELWRQAQDIEAGQAEIFLHRKLGLDSLFMKFANRVRR
ncbi:MAG: hypothetical protein AAGB31_02855 [Bdellovibrio sp.]